MYCISRECIQSTGSTVVGVLGDVLYISVSRVGSHRTGGGHIYPTLKINPSQQGPGTHTILKNRHSFLPYTSL